MKIIWKIDEADIQKVKTFYEKCKENPFVLKRYQKNISNNAPNITKEIFWKEMITCLLTTQQRSGPNSIVSKFIHTIPFPLKYDICASESNLTDLIETVITNFGGIRRGITIAKESTLNYEWLNNGGWPKILDMISDLKREQTKEVELKSVDLIMDNMNGFGPKQSRNLLQGLGLTRYEIPIDSRITKWLNVFGFPIVLSSQALADRNYYNFVSEGFQEICKACDIFPCLLDAVIFSSFDKEEWSKDNLI